jgi:hypothetical protein
MMSSFELCLPYCKDPSSYFCLHFMQHLRPEAATTRLYMRMSFGIHVEKAQTTLEMQEGTGHAVAAAWVELEFDNSDRRIPVRPPL